MRRTATRILLLVCLFLNSAPISSGQGPVVVTADQPNIWTLEQAHYLLAQMHRRNLDLKASPLSALDANAINGINVDVLRTLMEVGATFDESAQFKNSLLKKKTTTNESRRLELIRSIDSLNAESTQYAKTIARLKYEKEIAESDDAKIRKQAEITRNLEEKAAVDQQIALKNEELKTLTAAPSGEPTTTTSSSEFDTKNFPTGTFDETFKAKALEIIKSFNANPQLNASLQLDNFLQLQYEIISKQLTLLRDEVGPGERLIFLELPQSINASYDRSNNMWAQSRWRIAGYSQCVVKMNRRNVPCSAVLSPVGPDRSRNRPSRQTAGILQELSSQSNRTAGRYDLSLADVQDPEGFVNRFIGAEPDRFSARVATNVIVAPLLQTYTTEKAALEAAKQELSDRSGNLAVECGTGNMSSCTQLDRLKEDVARRKARLRDPAPELVNGLLTVLNAQIGARDQLNKNNEWNGIRSTSRTKLLSSITADAETLPLVNRLWIEDVYSNELHRLGERDFQVGIPDPALMKASGIDDTNKRPIRTVELIPRQSSFNVNDIKIRNKSSVFNFVASTLFGFGANFNYQQQRERYAQFVQQELYSSGFGKGAGEFGWTFTSMPGSNRLLSGVRTTYAVAIIPQEATNITLESTGCAFGRKTAQPTDFADAVSNKWSSDVARERCSTSKTFDVTIPGSGLDSSGDFDVSGMTYKPVKKGKRAVVSIFGRNFSSQIGVLINGVSLPSAIGVAQRFVRDDSTVGLAVKSEIQSDKVQGVFERIDSNQIVLVFEQMDAEEGTPTITLVAPGKAVDLNSLTDLYINGVRRTNLTDSMWMFGVKPAGDISFKDVQVYVSKSANGMPTELTALITGQAFGGISTIYVNGRNPSCSEYDAAGNCVKIGDAYHIGETVYVVKFPPPTEDKIRIVAVSGSETFSLDPLSNPASAKKPEKEPTIHGAELSFTVKSVRPFFADAKKERLSQLLVEISGVGFNSELTTSVGQLDVVDNTKAFVTLPEPKPAQTIRLTDKRRNVYAEAVVTIPE